MTDKPEIDQPCPPALRCPDRSLCPVACMEAGSREDPDHRPTRHPADRSLPYKWECICLPELLPTVAVNCRADLHFRPVPSADTEAPS